MYLKRLELQGFKSFADKTVLEFKPGITAVIGPNGSGKSNISDSIRWVLGEQSMKSLRGAKSEDIIFAGTQNRKSLGFAEASIVIDNTDGELPVEYAEVIVTRKIYRSGETGYFINKTPCRLKDILELFMDTGIGKDGYSIIGQGKIDEILSNKSEDRRHIFEEAAGIVKYRARKSESEKKLEQTKLNLLRINDILSEIEAGLDPLRIQSEKAKRFLELHESLKDIEVGLFIHNIETYKEKLEQVVEDLKILENQKNDEEKKLNNIQNKKGTLKKQIDELIEEIEKCQNIGFESTNQIEKINSEIGISNEKILHNKENNERLLSEIEDSKQKIKDLQEEKDTKKQKKDSLFSNKEKFEKELEEKEAELSKLTKGLSTKELEIEAKKQVIEKNTDLKYEKNIEISSLDANFENIEKRQKNIKTEIQETVSELDRTRTQKQDMSKEFQKIESEKNSATKELEENSNRKEKIENKIKEFNEQIDKMSYELRMKDSRQKFLIETEKEKEGYAKAVKLLLTDCDKNADLNKGVHGIIANLISVDKKYETAIEMTLGGMLQNIVTDSEEVAKKLVNHLRANNMGRASFLPITSIKGSKIDKIKGKFPGVIGVAADLVKFDKKYTQIVYNLLGRTVIVDNMDTGIALAKENKYGFRIVTIQGDIINASGAITGGSVAQKTVNILGRGREIENLAKEIEVLQNKISETKRSKQDYEESISEFVEDSKELDEKIQQINIVYATEKQKMLSVEEQILRLENTLSKLRNENEKIENQKADIKNQKQNIQNSVEDLEKEINELSIVIKEFAEANSENQKYIDDLNFDITNLKISVSSFDESGSSIDEIIERIDKDIENYNNAITVKNDQIEDLKREDIELKEKIESLKNQIIEIKNSVSTSTEKIEQLKLDRVNKNEELNKIEKDITDQFNLLEDLKGNLVKIDVKKTKLEQDIDLVVNNLWEEYELTPNNATDHKKVENVQTTQKEVNDIRAEIKDLGSINVDSIEEYKKTKERYDFMCEQRLDLENTISKLRKMISEITDTMKKQFVEKFKLINKNFNEVFVELFGGGKAELILEDEDNVLECGIDIKAQPTGKKLQNMMLLSGGEKAFTAIALLFAILKINPAPFCILDEIEAALDDVNVYRYAEYLKKFCSDTQFLVITHRKGTMEAADTVYGVTMEENGISKLLSMKLAQSKVAD
ncbi:MAG TPA: chromosome segregation protein SMC [Clostridiaceae bacterium]|nr:chromosome segregation protein SMC [Clostridiaceae bacterium]